MKYSGDVSPVGLAAWLNDKIVERTHTVGVPEKARTRDEMFDNITFYWLTNTAASSS